MSLKGLACSFLFRCELSALSALPLPSSLASRPSLAAAPLSLRSPRHCPLPSPCHCPDLSAPPAPDASARGPALPIVLLAGSAYMEPILREYLLTVELNTHGDSDISHGFQGVISDSFGLPAIADFVMIAHTRPSDLPDVKISVLQGVLFLFQ